MPLVYVAGPLRPTPERTAEEHIADAKKAASLVRSMGAYPVTPHLNTGHLFFEVPDGEDHTMRGALSLMARCDGVVVFGKWWFSSGTIAEIRAAMGVCIPVFQLSDLLVLRRRTDIPVWLNAPMSKEVFEEVLVSHNI